MSARSPIKLFDATSQELVVAEFVRGLSKQDLVAMHKSWSPTKQAILQFCRATNRTPPEHFHWDWRRKAPALDFSAYEALGISFDGKWQGAALVEKAAHQAQIASQRGKQILYLDYMETAPWNLARYVPSPLVLGIGTRFLEAVVKISIEEEWAGRLGLHSLPSSEEFYRQRGLIELGKDPRKQDLTYFEATPEIAENLRTGRKP